LKVFNPNRLLNLINKFVLYIFILGCLFLAFGFYYVFFISPNDYQQGIMVKIMYIHVPSAWLSMGIYTLIAIANLLFLIRKIPTASIIAKASAPLGLIFTLIVLISGIFWGRPMWGVWWVWDARLTSMLVLLFIYLGLILIYRMENGENKYSKIAAVYSILGLINIPIIKFSVDWWNTLHQPASVLRLDGPTIHTSMLYPLLIVFLGFIFLFLHYLLLSIKIELLENKFRQSKAN
jgi:heme exporter protein C